MPPGNRANSLRHIAESSQNVGDTKEHCPDERLKLLFVCAQMIQRLVRAKTRLCSAAIPFWMSPKSRDLLQRIGVSTHRLGKPILSVVPGTNLMLNRPFESKYLKLK